MDAPGIQVQHVFSLDTSKIPAIPFEGGFRSVSGKETTKGHQVSRSTSPIDRYVVEALIGETPVLSSQPPINRNTPQVEQNHYFSLKSVMVLH